MKLLKGIVAFCLLTLMSFSNKSTIDGDCSILHSGTFGYMIEKNKVKVVIEGDSHIEYHNGGKYIIQSKLVWLNDCEYNTTLVNVTIPNFPYAVGTVMNVKVDKVQGKTIYYSATIKGQSWPGELKKIK